MTPAQTREPLRQFRLALVLASVLASAGCAWLPQGVTGGTAAFGEPDLVACAHWYAQLDAATDAAGVRDAGATRVDGFAHLRVDRFHAALASDVDAARSGSDHPAQWANLVRRLRALDQQARGLELANLSAQSRAALAASVALNPAPEALLRHTGDCGDRLVGYDLQSQQQARVLLPRLVVPDDYSSTYRALGLYAISRAPFLAGVRRHEAAQRAAFAQDWPPPAGSYRIGLAPPARHAAGDLSPASLRQLLAPRAGDPLQIPDPGPAGLEILWARFAPTFEITVAGNDDLPGAVVWPAAAPAGAAAVPKVDTSTPVVYRHTALARYAGHNLLQLVYTLWFPARSRDPAVALDLLAGKLDGLVWRVTLAPDGTPLVYDSMHPCGCYHLFFPTEAAQPRPAPDAMLEWAFSPLPHPLPASAEPLVLRLAAGTHYLEQVRTQAAERSSPYTWRDYDTLRSLPRAEGGHRSMFNPHGFVDGTDRLESWLFWPMGIQRAGTMRQWGRHATAFVGRRHFDDPRLLEQRFVFDTSGWKP